MEAVYDKNKAKEQLERLIGEGKGEDESSLGDLLKEPEWFEGVKVKEITKDKVYGLVYTNNKGQPTDVECIFTVYGALVKKDLPPLKNGVKHLDAGKLRHIRQWIRLNDLGTEQFRGAVEAGAAVCELFDRVFKEGALEKWKESLTGNKDKLLDMSSKMVTPVNKANEQHHVPCDSSIDPSGVMDSILQKGFICTEDNVVQYSEGKGGLDGKRRYEKIGPQAFRIGDLVAAQLAFKVIVLKEGKTKKSRMVVVLRSLTLLSKSYNFKKEETQAAAPEGPVTLKRKLRSLEDPEVNEVGKKFNDMAVDGRCFKATWGA